MKIWHMITALFFGAFPACVPCYGNYVENVCAGYHWQSLPVGVATFDDKQTEAIERINDFFDTTVFEQVPTFKGAQKGSIKIIIDSGENEKTYLDDAVANTSNSCTPSKGILITGVIHYKASDYGDDRTINTIVHELFHSLGYYSHEEGIMCKFNNLFSGDTTKLINQSTGLLEWLETEYNIKHKN